MQRRRRRTSVPRQSSERERADVKKKRKRDILTHAPHALHSVTFTPSSPHHPFLHITLTCETTARGRAVSHQETPHTNRSRRRLGHAHLRSARRVPARSPVRRRARARARLHIFFASLPASHHRARARVLARVEISRRRAFVSTRHLSESTIRIDASSDRSSHLEPSRSGPIGSDRRREGTNEGARGCDARATSRRRIPERWRDEARDGRSR